MQGCGAGTFYPAPETMDNLSRAEMRLEAGTSIFPAHIPQTRRVRGWTGNKCDDYGTPLSSDQKRRK